MEKDKYINRYKFVRTVGVPIFKGLLKPNIIDEKFIPEDGPIILCGNHLHVWDQFPVICSTDRVTHWMSKKEYFDGKLGPFFKFTGAIAVDRGGDTSESKSEAIDYLNIGSAIGMFPEGTRNRLKDEKIVSLYNDNDFSEFISETEFVSILQDQNPLLSQINFLEKMKDDKRISSDEYRCALLKSRESLLNFWNSGCISENEFFDSFLLPFKFGAVSLAARTGAKIVPFAVNGDYQINNDNLVVRFGEPFQCNVNDLEQNNQELRHKVLSLEKENMRLK